MGVGLRLAERVARAGFLVLKYSVLATQCLRVRLREAKQKCQWNLVIRRKISVFSEL
jgi:hypothetical protein